MDYFVILLACFGICLVFAVWMSASAARDRRGYGLRLSAAEKALENLSEGVIVLDSRDRLVGYNRAATHIFTSLPTHKLGENIRALENFQKEMLREDTPWRFSNNGRHYVCRNKPFVDSNGNGLGHVLLILDVTDITAHIQEIDRARQQAEAASAAKSRFLANMSHEFRTPMNAIIGLNDLILEECEDPSIHSHAMDVRSAANDLLAIVNDILDLSKVEAGRMELACADYHLKTMADEVAGMMDTVAAQRGLVLQCTCDGNMPCRYNGDVGKIKRILINLLSNAIKFTEEGHVGLSITGEPGGDNEIITFRVEDTGCGIRQEDLGKIFEDFHRVDSGLDVEGTGLGLAIVKGLVELMNGSIHVESVYGEGTAVTVTIPQKIVDRRSIAEAPAAPRSEPERVETFSAPGVKALIVDDNTVGRKITSNFLKNYAFSLDEAESGSQAIELVRQNRYDIIFMDHRMSGMDGIETAAVIRRDCGENGTAPAIIALTANAMEGIRQRFLDQGFQDCITKPLDRRELDRILVRWVPEDRRQAVDGGEPYRPLDPNAFKIEGIDMNAAVGRHSSGEIDFAGLLELYYLDGQRKLPLLRELAVSDIDGYQTEVHALKSASADIGAVQISDMARAQENAAAQGDRELIDRQLPLLLEAYGELLEKIGRALEQRRQNAPGGEKLPALSEQELLEQVGEALRELENFRSQACAGIVETVLRHQLPQDAADSLEEIRKQLRLYEDDNAEMLLHQLLNRLKKQEE